MTSRIARSEVLSVVPSRKIEEALEQIIRDCKSCSQTNVKIGSGSCRECLIRSTAINRYAESNIPVRYWKLEMEKDFKGDSILLEKYQDIKKDIGKAYRDGISLCFAGSHGLGKSMTCCNILKRAVEKDFSALYVNLNDIISVMLQRDSEERATARRELLMVDFLVIDEFDPRYMSNDKASDLFGKILEEIFRTRHQNGLPILMCTNSPSVVDSFTGPIKQSITSLMSCVRMVAVLGKDYRISSNGK